MNHTELQSILKQALLPRNGSAKDRLQAFAEGLWACSDDFYWVGFYVLHDDVLKLGPFKGPATDHQEIAIGQGVCGTAVAENAHQLVADVSQRENYLACNLQTKSELVVLIRDSSGAIVGQIDIDGTRTDLFSPRDMAFLESFNDDLYPLLKQLPSTPSS